MPSLAFLVGLAFRNGDDDAAGRPLDRLAIDAAAFRPPERPSESDEQQGAIPDIPDRVAKRSHDDGQLLRGECYCTPLRAPVGAPNTAERSAPDEF